MAGSRHDNEPEDVTGDASRLEEALGYRFSDSGLFVRALTHPSYAYEQAIESPKDNQRLEFLGDAVLGLVIAKSLFSRYPGLSEGRLSRIKAALVCEETLARLASALGVGDHVRLGKGERANGGAEKASVLSDTLEAIFGAVFLDGGYEAAQSLIVQLFDSQFENAYRGRLLEDHKTRLQEWVQARGQPPPEYTIKSHSGPPHDRTFTVEVKVGGGALGAGLGSSKKEAEMLAAAQALETLRRREDTEPNHGPCLTDPRQKHNNEP